MSLLPRLRRRRLLPALTLLATALHARSDGPLEVQVMPPWNILKTGPVAPSHKGGEERSYGTVPDILPYILDALILGLEKRGFIAYPALYASGVQLTSTFEDKAMVEAMLAREFPEQREYLTVVPVVHGAQVLKRSMMLQREMELGFRLELHVQSKEGKLGSLLLTQEVALRFSVEDELDWRDFEPTFPELERKIAGSAEWEQAAVRLTASAGSFKTRFQAKRDSGETGPRQYFAQSEIFTNLPTRQSRLSKVSFHCAGSSAQELDDLAFPFQANDKWPVFQYAYIVQPGRRAIRVRREEAHIEQSPGALPSRIYDWSRVLVVNLPGLEIGSVVTYAVNFMRFPAGDEQRRARGKKRDWPILAKDGNVFTRRGQTFQVRSWSLPSDTVRIAARDAELSSPEILKLPGATLQIHSGKAADEEARRPGGREDPYYPMFRISNLGTWEELLAATRDSVLKRLPIQAPRGAAAKMPEEDAVTGIHRFIHDSLRYVSLSFGERAYVPAWPDSVLKHRMGDCKDFSVLFIDRMRKAGVEAWPALIHSRFKNHLFDGPPSYEATDHMVVYLPGRDWWVDPTTAPTPPDTPPYRLSGAQALVLYPDSIVRRRLPAVNDTDFTLSISYSCRPQGADLACKRKTVQTRRVSWGLRSWLANVPREKWAGLLHPEEWQGPFRVTETSGQVPNFDARGEKLVVTREFISHRAVTRMGGRSVMRFPETPGSAVFDHRGDEDTSAALEFDETYTYDIDFEMRTEKPLQWPSAKEIRGPGYEFKVIPGKGRGIRVRLHIAAGRYQGADKAAVKAILREYKDFFSTGLVSG